MENNTVNKNSTRSGRDAAITSRYKTKLKHFKTFKGHINRVEFPQQGVCEKVTCIFYTFFLL